MTLAQFQRTLKTLLMTAEGKTAISSPAHLEAFLEQQPLDPVERACLKAEPMARYEQYQYMVWANVQETMEAMYPYTCALLGDEKEALLTQYSYDYPNRSYQMMAVGEAFPQFLQTQTVLVETYPFLPELALYEWVEAALLSAPNEALPEGIRNTVPQHLEALAQWIPVMNPVAQLLQLQYPIPHIMTQLNHQQTPSADLKPTWVWVYRDMGPYYCRFIEVTPFVAQWLALVEVKPQTYLASLQAVFSQWQALQPDLPWTDTTQGFLQCLPDLLAKHLLIGSLPVASSI